MRNIVLFADTSYGFCDFGGEISLVYSSKRQLQRGIHFSKDVVLQLGTLINITILHQRLLCFVIRIMNPSR